jgi:hypothetical protein
VPVVVRENLKSLPSLAKTRTVKCKPLTYHIGVEIIQTLMTFMNNGRHY